MEKLEASVVIEHIESDKPGYQTSMYKMYFNFSYTCLCLGRFIIVWFELSHALSMGDALSGTSGQNYF